MPAGPEKESYFYTYPQLGVRVLFDAGSHCVVPLPGRTRLLLPDGVSARVQGVSEPVRSLPTRNEQGSRRGTSGRSAQTMQDSTRFAPLRVFPGPCDPGRAGTLR